MHKGIPFVGQEITQSRDFAEAFEKNSLVGNSQDACNH